MLNAIAITKADLQRAFLVWETKARNGECPRTLEDALKLPAEQVASENTDYVWSLLDNPTAKVSL